MGPKKVEDGTKQQSAGEEWSMLYIKENERNSYLELWKEFSKLLLPIMKCRCRRDNQEWTPNIMSLKTKIFAESMFQISEFLPKSDSIQPKSYCRIWSDFCREQTKKPTIAYHKWISLPLLNMLAKRYSAQFSLSPFHRQESRWYLARKDWSANSCPKKRMQTHKATFVQKWSQMIFFSCNHPNICQILHFTAFVWNKAE